MAMTERRELEAARWAERLVDDSDAADFPRFAQWCDRPDNSDAYRRAVAARRLVAGLADDPALEQFRDEARSRAPMAGRTVHLRRTAAVTAAVALLATPVFWMTRSPPTAKAPVLAMAPITHATARGQRQVVLLPDGSRLTLDTASRIRVAYTGSERRLRLEAGQVLFEVARDAARPFIVSAGNRQVVARGTVFNMRLDADRLRVALIEGKVDVGARGSRAVSMKPNDVLTARGREVTVRRAPATVAALVDWRDGLLVFQDRPLAEAVAEMNRYATRPLVLGDAGVGAVRISGSFRPEQIPSFLEALEIGFPVAVTRRDDGALVLTSRG